MVFEFRKVTNSRIMNTNRGKSTETNNDVKEDTKEKDRQAHDKPPMQDYGYGNEENPIRIKKQGTELKPDESLSNEPASGRSPGRGPRGDKRSDHQIREEINSILTGDEMLDASDVIVSVNTGEVSLTGTIADTYSKERAGGLVEAVAGVRHVENKISIGATDPEEPLTDQS